MSTDVKNILEALLFVAEAPLTSIQLLQVLDSSDQAGLKVALAALRADYAVQGRAFELAEVAGGHILRTRPEFGGWIRRLKREQVTKFSRAALETLAIIAYKQPVLKAEIERMRGVEVGGVLRMLMEKDLVRVVGRKDLPGRPLIYGTTRRFLEVFDLNELNDLPTLEEMEALAGEQQGELFVDGVSVVGNAGEDGGFDEGGLAEVWEERLLTVSGEGPESGPDDPSADAVTADSGQPGIAESALVSPPAGAEDHDEVVGEGADCDPSPEAA